MQFNYKDGPSKCKGCEISIQNGKRCNKLKKLGEPFYAPGLKETMGGKEPWPLKYAAESGTAKQRKKYNNGYTINENWGKLVVMYDADGEVVACGRFTAETKSKCEA